MNDFETRPSPKLVVGPGKLTELPRCVVDLGVSKVLVVTDAGIVAAGHVGRALEGFRVAGIEAEIYEGVHENPTESDIEACRVFAEKFQPEGIIGLGGGSSMDTAKGCNFVLNNGGTMSDYRGYGLAKAPMLPFIAVPTTAGTGSECQSYAVVSREDSHEKMACGDPKALARVAILDPELTLSQPPRVAALTALDAMAHALESAVSTRRNPLSQLYAKEAFRLIASGIEMVLQEAALMEHRENVMLGAAMAGLAIENSMLGAAHAAANPLTARFGIPHGEAVSLMLPSVLRFNREKSPATAVYLELSALIHEPLVEWVEQVIALAGLPGFAAAGVEESHLAELASEASKQWTGQFNPRAVTEADFMTLYAEALKREEVPV